MHRVLMISLRAPQRTVSTFVGFTVADTRQFRLYRDAVPLLLIVLGRLVQIDRGLPHLRRVPERKREMQRLLSTNARARSFTSPRSRSNRPTLCLS